MYVYIYIDIFTSNSLLITLHTQTSIIYIYIEWFYSLDELKPLSRSSQAFELKQNLPNCLPNLSLIGSARSFP